MTPADEGIAAARRDDAERSRKSAVTRVNEALRRAGRDERVVRARGYYRLHAGESHRFRESGLYGLGARMLGSTDHDFRHLKEAVETAFRANAHVVPERPELTEPARRSS